MENEQPEKTMVRNVRSIFHLSLYRRLASVTITSTCILCTIPVNGICLANDDSLESTQLANEILAQLDFQNIDSLLEKFDQFESVLDASTDPLTEGRAFLTSFVNGINAQYGLTLTLHDACALVQENLQALNLPEETQKIILATIELYMSDSSLSNDEQAKLEDHSYTDAKISWPGNWFGLNHDVKHKHKKLKFPTCSATVSTDKELPGNFYIGGCEILAGALLCVLGIVYTPAAVLGVGLITDGGIRVMEGVNQVSEERRNDPNYIPPEVPGFDF